MPSTNSTAHTAGRLTPAQSRMLQDIAAGDGPTDYADFFLRSGSSALGWRNRERVIAALLKRELIDDNLKITDTGLAAIAAAKGGAE